MEKIKKYARTIYASASAKWIFGVVAALGVLPDLIKTILLCVTKESLSTGTIFFADLFCVACACVFALLPVRLRIGPTKRAVSVWLKGCLPCMAALYGGNILTVFLGDRFGMLGKIIGWAAAGILLGLSFYLLGSAMSSSHREKAGRKIIRIAICILLAMACWYLLPYFFGLGVQAAFAGNKAWCVKLAAELLSAVFRWALLMPVLKFVCVKETQETIPEEKASTKANKPLLSYIPTFISAAVLLISAVLLFPNAVSPADRLKTNY